MSSSVIFLEQLPDPESARRFLVQLADKHPSLNKKLVNDLALLSDVLTLVSHSPLLAATLLQNPEYIWWLKRRRADTGVRNKDELLESLARFTLTNSQLSHQILFARFRRRELLRILLADIRRLEAIAEITEEISNLADAILESALRVARQELDNRYGSPQEIDEKGKKHPAKFCVVSLGKLGSMELNYASDIDLLFLYSADGETSGGGTRAAITNREYFVKLSESIAKLVGEQTGEGATYRVDLRLRPHGRVGPLAMSVRDTARYYKAEAADWERQVLIRSRGSAGETEIYRQFFELVEEDVFSKDQSVEKALRSVRLSKQKIDIEHQAEHGFDVKLGKGGIREIEFIAQALQLAYGGKDKWLRSGHTLISLSRLADRKLITETELTQLFDAYDFLRRLEHILQMDHGLQTHLVPNEPEKRSLVARKIGFDKTAKFETQMRRHTVNVNKAFRRVFSDKNIEVAARAEELSDTILSKPELTDSVGFLSESQKAFHGIGIFSLKITDILSANPHLAVEIPNVNDTFEGSDYSGILRKTVESEIDFGLRLGALRKSWSILLFRIIAFDAAGKLRMDESKHQQTLLAEASIEMALSIARQELERKYSMKIERLDLAVMGLGKLGGAGIDYDSDLDLVLVYDDEKPLAFLTIGHAEFYARAAEIFVNVLSGMTRDGSLYRVDLRLRPHGKNGPSVISQTAFADYMRRDAAIWELLAYVKIRAVGGNQILAKSVESDISALIHDRAAGISPTSLAEETQRIRIRLENERSAGQRSGDVDIKFGAGGMLDIYFAIRYLQLRDNVPDDPSNRSTGFMLAKLRDRGSRGKGESANLFAGYTFLSSLDHNLRLVVGRSTLLPRANRQALETIALRMEFSSPMELNEQLAIHRLNIREAFDSVLAVRL